MDPWANLGELVAIGMTLVAIWRRKATKKAKIIATARELERAAAERELARRAAAWDETMAELDAKADEIPGWLAEMRAKLDSAGL